MTISLHWYQYWYRFSVSMNLRLPEHLASSVKSLAQETGKSQQALIREAIEMYLRDYLVQAYPPEIRHAITPASRSLVEILQELPDPLPWTGDRTLLETLREMREDRV